MKIGIVGRGNVGKTLGTRFAGVGCEVRYGVQSPSQADELSVESLATWAEVIFLTVPAGAIAEPLFKGDGWHGKVVVDATNPISPTFDGLEWGEDNSWGERVARLLPKSKVIKSFNTVGFNVMENPAFDRNAATMLVAGDDLQAKTQVMDLAESIGFSAEDAGPLSQSRWLEAFAWLWISMAVKYGHGRDMAFLLTKR